MAKSSLKLNLYCSSSKGSKSYWAFEALEKSWPYGTRRARNELVDDGIHVFWGLVGQNAENIKELQRRRQQFIFIDMPYWNRWLPGQDPTSSSWRVIVNGLHVNHLDNFDDKRSVPLKPQRSPGEYILVCPSSYTLNQFYEQPNWLNDTIKDLKAITDRPIKIRQKPRSNHTSGPSVADVPLEQDLNNAYCVVTMASIVGVESLIYGVPAISASFGPIGMLDSTRLNDIDSITFPQRSNWVNTLGYHQWTVKELENGIANEHILKELNGQ